MVRRLTEKPFLIRRNVPESSAGTFTEVSIQLPIAPVLGRGTLQAVELMAMVSDIRLPDIEDDQSNSVSAQLTKDSQTGSLQVDSDQVLWNRVIQVENEFTTSGSGTVIHEAVKNDDMTDYDGNGQIVAEQTIHLGIVGSGNAATRTVRIKMLAHLVALDADDAIILLLEAD